MNMRAVHGRCIVAAGAILVVASALAADADPWTRVVAPPTGCYSSQDEFAAKNEVAIESLVAETARLQAVNKTIEDRLGGQMSADPMAFAAHMQEMMMKDPQA